MGDDDGRRIGRAGRACTCLVMRREGRPPGSVSGRCCSGPSGASVYPSTGLGRNLATPGAFGVALACAGHSSATLNLSLPAMR